MAQAHHGAVRGLPRDPPPCLPSGVELDLLTPAGEQPRCYVSLVGFLFDRVRLKGLPIPLHTRFEEVNLRFYVRRPLPDGTFHRGVVFIREFVPLPAITVVANAFYEEPYATLPTRCSIADTAESLTVRYDWRHDGTWHHLAVEAESKPRAIAPGSEEEFITEHYWGYTKRRPTRLNPQGSTSAYQVDHPRWQVYPIQRYSIAADFAALYGPAFAGLDTQPPSSILLAEGSAVSVGHGLRLPTANRV